MTEIKNFIPTYPDRTDPELGKKLAHLKEFLEKSLEADEPEHHEPGVPYNHQVLQGRYVNQHTLTKSCIFWHGLGAGKTCVASILVENFKNTFVNGERRKPALIILKSAHLREAFRSSIGKECTKAIYTTNLDKELIDLKNQGIVEINERTLRTRMNAAIGEFYEIVTARELFDSRKARSDEYNMREYSNRIIIIDESHSYRDQPQKEEKEEGKKSHTPSYEPLHHFLHILENPRVFLMTGTPIWDLTYDFSSQMNLILPMSEQLPRMDEFIQTYFDGKTLRPEKIEELKNIMRGRISYIRSKRTDKRIDHGTATPWLKFTKVYPSIMSNFQYIYSEEAKKFVKAKEFDILKKDKKQSGGSYLTAARDAANCVYPEIKNKALTGKGVYGTDIFLKYAATETTAKVTKSKIDKKTGATITSEKDRIINSYGFKNEYAKILKEELGPNYNDPNGDIFSNLRKYSTKFATVLEMLLDPERLQEKAFIYLDSVNGTGGAISFALIAQLYGFKWIHSPSAIGSRSEMPTIENPGSFIVITTELGTIKDAAQIRDAIDKCNSDDNVYGQQCRFIIGSKTISHGHSLKAFRQTHVVAGFWNFPSIDQPTGRTYRLGSFKQLPLEERFANFYMHVGVVEGDEENGVEGKDWVKLPKDTGNLRGKVVSTKDTIDIHIYKAAEIKEVYNSQLFRLMKIMAWDCSLAYNRNVLNTDTEGSRECDLQECDYVCDGYTEEGVDYVKHPDSEGLPRIEYLIDSYKYETSNYNLLYSEKETDEFIRNIRALFKNYFVLNFTQIMLNLNALEEQKFIVLRALSRVINEKIPIINMYGFKTFLKEDQNFYFLDEGLQGSNYHMSIYEIFPFVSEHVTFEDAIETVQLNEDLHIVSTFVKDPTMDNFNVLSYRTKIVLLESIIQDEYSGVVRTDKATKIVKSSLQKEIYEMDDGVLVHNMYNNKEAGARYSVLTKDLKVNGKLRVLDPSDEYEVKWKFVIPSNEAGYIAEIKRKIETSTTSGFENNPYDMYGLLDKTEKFKIVRKGNKGIICGTIPVPEIIEICYKLNHLPYSDEINPDIADVPKAEVKALLVSNTKWADYPHIKSGSYKDMSVDKLKKLYTLYSMTKKDLCESVERWFRGENPDKKAYFQ